MGLEVVLQYLCVTFMTILEMMTTRAEKIFQILYFEQLYFPRSNGVQSEKGNVLDTVFSLLINYKTLGNPN